MNVWTSNGPYGGHIITCTIHPANPDILYAGCDDSGGIFKTIDGGETWTYVSSSVIDVCGWAIAIDPQSPNNVYACDIYGFGVYKSANDGVDWNYVNAGLDETHVTSLAIDENSSNVIYAGTGGWRFSGNGVYKSINGGANWISSGLTGMKVYSLILHPGSSTVLYAGTHGDGLHRSTDAGNTWSQLSLPAPYVNCLAIDPLAANVIYAGTLTGIFCSTDSGSTWDSLGLSQEIIWSMAIDPQATNIMYASTLWNGIQKSTDGGLTWAPINSGINYPITFSITVDPTSPGTLYLGTAAGGVYKSINGGAYWTQKIQGMRNTYVFGLVPHPDTADIIYAGRCYAEPGCFFYRSMDGGQNWASLTQFVNVGLTSLIIDPADLQVFYAGAIKAIVKTTDHGATWILCDSLFHAEERVPSMAIDPLATNIVYAAAYIVDPDTGVSVRKSVDSGGNWTEVAFFPKTITSNALDPESDILHGGAVAVNPNSPSILYAGAFGGVYRSTDGGNMWSGPGLTDEAIFTLEIDPVNYDILYTGCESGRAFKSTDAGNSWAQIDPGWSPAMVTDILVDPSSPADVYIGRDASDWHTGSHGGVAHSTDGGGTWVEIDSGLTTTHTIRLAIDTTTKTLYAATYGGGVFSYTFATGIEEESLHDDVRRPGYPVLYPNPFRDEVKITLPPEFDRGSATLKVFDATGRMVKELSPFSVRGLPVTVISWDGHDNAGRQLPSGVYIIICQTRALAEVRKLLLIR